jgi:ArsR family transcriptional regulator
VEHRAWTLSVTSKGEPSVKDIHEIHENAERASKFIKALANETRLVVLCALVDGEKNVGELEHLLGVRQPTLSQQLARLRSDELVSTRRQAKQIYYSIASDEAELLLGLISKLFCADGSTDLVGRPASPAAAEAEAA